MSHPTRQQISSSKAILGPLDGSEPYSRLIDCPQHPKAHTAALYCFGHKFAGTWECPETGMSDSHEHVDYNIESATTNYLAAGEPVQYDSEVYVCGICGVQIEDADPQIDRLEHMVGL